MSLTAAFVTGNPADAAVATACRVTAARSISADRSAKGGSIRISGVSARQGRFHRRFIRSDAGYRTSHLGHPRDPDAPLYLKKLDGPAPPPAVRCIWPVSYVTEGGVRTCKNQARAAWVKGKTMANYALSAVGSAVARITPVTKVAASTLKTSLLNGGFTAVAGSGGSMTVTSYDAEFSGGSGGGVIEATYDNGAALQPGQQLEWVQVGTDNDPIPGYTASPWLDNANAPENPNASSLPFYTSTAADQAAFPKPAGLLSFYDFSQRDPAALTKVNPINPITWNATLYPVVESGKTLTVHDGVSWGWTLSKAMVGTDSGTFVNPSPSSAIVTGLGTNTFTWGGGQPNSLIEDVSSLSFIGGNFDTSPNTPFKLGTLTFHNGTNGGGADSVELDTQVNLNNVPEKNFPLKTNFSLINTTNTSDPVASADQVVIGNAGYRFDVLEGATAAVDLYGTLSTGLSVTPLGAEENSASSTGPFDPGGDFQLKITSITSPTSGGIVTAAFNIMDSTTGVSSTSGGTPYTGPASGVQYEYIQITKDNLNITAGLPNVFIHTGDGVDAIDVSKVNGTNVLDGGTSSNFLVGGTDTSGADTFFVDDRRPSGDIWSTVANFHVKDAATIFGITPMSATLDWENGQGAAGFTGLTLHVTTPGAPTASLTLSGYTKGDLTNGRLSTSFGTEPDGTPYLYIHA